ncbi:arsenite methyltransferase [archaeon]|jgi:arsenite methyltransferase|nr:arsenite methyltransferase [archaeon]MBT3577204.1 arsenite methyltransferase [archaeon]MBT6820213.1 arsenite methyltransferase [archaeon]MBT6956755.1 arsenite methyltransferase [archaeon]MBT7025418.1 arsenite methyltransferase [archaeon]
MENNEVKKTVREGYAKIASDGGCSNSCGCSLGNANLKLNDEISKSIGYSDEEINNVPEANLGLGCGNPTALGGMEEGQTVLDLGSGAGFDVFLASKKVGDSGKVIGVDMTPEMIARARDNAEKYGYKNTEFRLGDIEDLPVDDNSVDIVISNCVVNLAPNKEKVFGEVHRVLRSGGKMYVSDIVLLGELSDEQKDSDELMVGCVAGAVQREDYISKIEGAGFKVNILGEDKEISKRQYTGIALESLKIEAIKLDKEANNGKEKNTQGNDVCGVDSCKSCCC